MGKVKRQTKKARKALKIATKQAETRVSPRSGVAPPTERQFGQPNGNPRSNGAWKKEDTLRYKLEKLINGIDEEELKALLEDPKTKPGLKRLAILLYKSNYEKPESEWRVWEGALNQAYGMPKQSVEQTNLEPPLPLSPRGMRGGGAGGAERSDATTAPERAERSGGGKGAPGAQSASADEATRCDPADASATPAPPRSDANEATASSAGKEREERARPGDGRE